MSSHSDLIKFKGMDTAVRGADPTWPEAAVTLPPRASGLLKAIASAWRFSLAVQRMTRADETGVRHAPVNHDRMQGAYRSTFEQN